MATPFPDDPRTPEEEARRPAPAPGGSLPILNEGFEDEDDFDPDDEGFEDGEDEIDEGPRTVLITGASGNIGRKLRAAWDDRYDLVLVDRTVAPDDPDVIVADLTVLDESWMGLFQGVDTVVHLAGNPDQHAPWDELVGPNIDAVANVFQAAALAGVDRIVFASSNHAMGGYKDLGDIAITPDLAPRPGNAYGATKLMGERLGVALSGVFDLSFVALRIGWVQPGANSAATLPDEWGRGMWLSDADMVHLFDRAVEADLGERNAVVVNGMSRNHGSRWDLAESFEAIGFSPVDDAFADQTAHPGPGSLG